MISSTSEPTPCRQDKKDRRTRSSRSGPAVVPAIGATVLLSCLFGCSGALEEYSDATPVTFSDLYDAQFTDCALCHSPGGAGRTSETEQTLDFTSAETGESAVLNGAASGLVGNQAGCNGVPFVGSSPDTSLILAVLDDGVRANFSLASFPDCNANSISDMTIKLGRDPDQAFLDDLRSWLEDQTGAVSRL